MFGMKAVEFQNEIEEYAEYWAPPRGRSWVGVTRRADGMFMWNGEHRGRLRQLARRGPIVDRHGADPRLRFEFFGGRWYDYNCDERRATICEGTFTNWFANKTYVNLYDFQPLEPTLSASTCAR
jgi:hypothetical protein